MNLFVTVFFLDQIHIMKGTFDNPKQEKNNYNGKKMDAKQARIVFRLEKGESSL